MTFTHGGKDLAFEDQPTSAVWSSGEHWMLLVADVEEKTVAILNPKPHKEE